MEREREASNHLAWVSIPRNDLTAVCGGEGLDAIVILFRLVDGGWFDYFLSLLFGSLSYRSIKAPKLAWKTNKSAT